MNIEYWSELTEELTGAYDVKVANIEPQDNNHVQLMLDFFRSQAVDSPHKSLLDVGCQDDHLRKHIYADWSGCDIHEDLDSDVTLADIHTLSWVYAGEFDIVYCNHVLEHVLSPVIALRELRELLCPNGSLFVGVPVWPHFVSDQHVYLLTDGAWKHLFRHVGFEVVDMVDHEHSCYYRLRKVKL